MGIRGEIFSNKVSLPNRTYFFNVKENRMGDLYLNIVESKNRDSGGFERQSVILFADDLQEFLKGFDESLRVMEKAMREKKHSGGSAGREKRDERPDRERAEGERDRADRGGGHNRDRSGRRGDQRRGERKKERTGERGGGDRSRQRSDGRDRGRRERSGGRGSDQKSEKRFVVKKKD